MPDLVKLHYPKTKFFFETGSYCFQLTILTLRRGYGSVVRMKSGKITGSGTEMTCRYRDTLIGMFVSDNDS